MMQLYSLWLASCFLATVNGATISGTIYVTNGSYQFVPNVIDKQRGAAYGTYEQSGLDIGWGVLNIAAGYAQPPIAPDDQLMKAAGMLEGILTWRDIYSIYVNTMNYNFNNASVEVEKIQEFFQTQREWMEGMIASNDSTHWYYTNLIYAQFQGLVEGYTMAAPSNQQLDISAFDFLCGFGDILDIVNFISPSKRPNLENMTKEDIDKLLDSGHCSALIKALPGYEDVFMAHSTWFEYVSMNRIYKHYAFRLADQNAATKVMSFSSYPGYLSSTDDFYIMDSKLVMLETTNSILNSSLYDSATPKALLAWHRVRLANWLATGGEQWAGYISEYNSGTYNNQYMVLDLKKITLKSNIADDALWVVEQIPGYVASGDQTPILRTGYWASYNIPFYEYVYNVSGYPELVKKYGPEYSYQLAPRAKIFRRDEAKVVDMNSFEALMRSNDYMNDPYSQGNPKKAICSRGDLSSTPSPDGCTDTKATNLTMALSLSAYAQSGPTHETLAPFDWSSVPQFQNISRVGQPVVFNFNFVEMTPSVP
ncbi:hypothetical protein EMCRGX_G001516 [Ephydatia muelleri]